MLAAVWLAHDTYEYNSDPLTISVTTLLGSTRSIIIGSRLGETSSDISGSVASSLGTAIHDSIEGAWVSEKLAETLKSLGQPNGLIKQLAVNPDVPTDGVDIYFERRTNKEIAGYTISGKFDAILNGVITDIKTTGVFTYIKKVNDRRYREQLSIYRWLNPTLVTETTGTILYIFKDWKAHLINTTNYPKAAILDYKVKLLSLQETENLIETKLAEIKAHLGTPNDDLPRCTPYDLWQDKPTYAYMAKADAKRASKTFDCPIAANQHLQEKGKGIVVTRLAEPTKCKWCSARPNCNQAQGYIDQGVLKI